MSERKVLTKYYPPDFDPSLVGRSRGPKQTGPKVQTVRLMAPFSFRCTACGEYTYKGRKFNAKKETKQGEMYLNSIQIHRFYIRCTRCSAEITFRTDPKNQDYVMERGAKRNTEPWRRGLEGELEESDEARLDRIEREMVEADGEGGEERNAMAELEAKTADAKREMAVADALDEIRSRNARVEKAHREGVEIEAVVAPSAEDELRRKQEEEDAEAARRAFAFAREQEKWEEPMDEDEDIHSGGNGEFSSRSGAVREASATATPAQLMPPPPKPTAPSTEAPLPTFKRQVKKKKDHSALLGIKKKQPLI